MLRCPPSLINLTSSDTAVFEQRFVARHTALSAQLKANNIQLSPGPARSTSLSLVTAEQNIGRKRAASSSSEATLHTANGGEIEPIQHAGNDHEQARVEAARALESVLHQSNAPSQPSARRHIRSYYDTTSLARPSDPMQATIEPLAALDGAAYPGGPHSSVEVRCGFLFTEHSIPPREAASDVHNTSQLLCSARARRRNGRSLNEHISCNSSEPIELEVDNSVVVPDIVLQQDSDLLSANPALDPGAPVFVPRIRFGTTTGSSADLGVQFGEKPRWSSVDSTHSSVNLRIRSSFERNSDLPLASRQLSRDPSGSSIDHTHFHRQRENASRRQRWRSRTTDESPSSASLSANLGRYPLLRPPSTINAHRRSIRVSSHNGSRAHNARQSSSSASYLEGQGTRICPSEDGNTMTHPVLPMNEEMAHLTSASRRLPGNNRSTPNLLRRPISPGRIYGRRSSLPWNRSGPSLSSNHRVPSMASAASAISGGAAFTRRSSAEGLDAASEVLRMRNSPLDDLTERLSRLSASRHRSAGRSWERTPSSRPRVSLLAGDPFRPDPCRSAEARRETILLHTEPVMDRHAAEAEVFEEVDATAEELVALSLALPPSSPLSSNPPARPTTPSVCHSAYTSPLSSTNDDRVAKSRASPPSCIKRKPVPGASKTSKLPVYDDSKPPSTQPQTSADVRRSIRRAKARSDDTTNRPSPHTASRVKISSPPTIPERHPHRNTFPSTSPRHRGGNSVTPARSANTSAVRWADATPVRSTRRTAQVQDGDNQVENDLTGHLPELEADRRVWESRQETGTLDVTPPRAGRFEQYMT